MLKLHHSGFIVKDIDTWEKNMLCEEKVGDVTDPIQNARLALYRNFGSEFIELIQPLNEKAFTWNSLVKWGNHFNHSCYSVDSLEEMEQVVQKYRLISILPPVPALLFNGKNVAFYYNRNRQVVEFLLNNVNDTGIKAKLQEGVAVLDTIVFRNGTGITETIIKEDWIKTGIERKPAWCYYDNDFSKSGGRGRLYNWYAVNDSRGLAPQGWHIPTKEELIRLIEINGGKKTGGAKMKKLSGWEAKSNNPQQTIDNSEIFPYGFRNTNGDFFYAGERYFIWSATEKNGDYASSLYMFENGSKVSIENTNKASGFLVICIKD